LSADLKTIADQLGHSSVVLTADTYLSVAIELGLPAFQMEVARLFFALPASEGFLLAGGAALLAQHLTARPTEDLDFFTAPDRGHVPAARDALEAAARQRGWSTGASRHLC
jgi:hypothetical protein